MNWSINFHQRLYVIKLLTLFSNVTKKNYYQSKSDNLKTWKLKIESEWLNIQRNDWFISSSKLLFQDLKLSFQSDWNSFSENNMNCIYRDSKRRWKNTFLKFKMMNLMIFHDFLLSKFQQIWLSLMFHLYDILHLQPRMILTMKNQTHSKSISHRQCSLMNREKLLEL